jgi:hypothetical protein
MKVHSCPNDIPAPTVDYNHYDQDSVDAAEAEHQTKLKAWLKANGYPGGHTGEIFSTPFADGAAQYMFADGPKPCLIHLPYGDAWNNPDVKFLPKREVLNRIKKSAALAALFAKQQS